MRILSSSYWNKFLTKNSKGKLIRDGLLFEDLIEELLSYEYPAAWTRTKRSHDYNRDFHITTKDNRIWAECKNHNDDISLETIAPTLVMAQIFAVNKIIFFSYSSVNRLARQKIYAFASRTEKNMYIVDEALLDQLIIKNKNSLSKKFRPIASDIIVTDIEKKCDVDFYFSPNPIIGSTLEDRLVMPISSVEQIFYNDVFEIFICCEPNYIDHKYHIVITVDSADREINEHYELVDAMERELTKLRIVKDFSSSSGWIQRILLKPRLFHSFLPLPVIKAEIFYDGKSVSSIKSPHKMVKNIWSRQTILIGEQYRNLVINFEQLVLQRGSLGCMLVVGQSGVGKTRILKECLEVLLRYKYKIASFIGNEADSARTILKEIIYFVYEVPREEIFKNLEEVIENRTNSIAGLDISIKAYELARKIGKDLSDAEVLELIDKHFDIIFERISSEAIAIVIDNLQFFGVPLTYFFQKYIDYAKHQTRSNKSVLLLSVNSDYLNSNTRAFLDYINEIEKDRPEFLCRSIHGFSDLGQAIVFLRQSLNIENHSLDVQLETLAKKTSLIPYYIYQALYSLLDEQIVMHSEDNSAFISNITKFYVAIENMPDSIYKILNRRWEFLLKNNNLNEAECKSICSLISIIGPIDNQIMDSFQLDEHYLPILCQHSFLRQDEDENFVFDHDIIEAFFLWRYHTKYYEIFSHIKNNLLEDELMMYSFLSHFYELKKANPTIERLREIVDYYSRYPLPYKIEKDYFTVLFKYLLPRNQSFSSCEEWLSNVNKACNTYRNVIGFKNSLSNYQCLNDRIEQIGYTYFFKYPGFRNYINTYTDILLHLRKSELAISFLENIFALIPDEPDDDISLTLKAMVCNRLMINHREFESECHISKRNQNLELSYMYTKKIRDEHLRDEFMYLNLSDEGYVYYALAKNRNILLSIWNQCREYTPKRLPQKTLNYYRKMIQLSFINDDAETVREYIDAIEQYLNKSIYTGEKLIFQLFALTAQTMYWLMDNPVEHYHILAKSINDLMLLAKLKGGNKEYDILNLRAITAFYNGDETCMLTAFKEAYCVIMHIEATMHLNEKKEMLIHNIMYACISCHCHDKLYGILYDKSKSWIDNEAHIYRHTPRKAKGIIKTRDKQFNLPVIV